MCDVKVAECCAIREREQLVSCCSLCVSAGQWRRTSVLTEDVMALLKKPQKAEPLVKEWDRKAQKSGSRHTVYAVNGDEYTGDWQDNKKHGKGTQIYKKTGAIYDGDWECGKWSGKGTLSLPDPNTGEYVKVYSGDWKNDKKHGFGTNFYNESAYYEGEWRRGERCGWGRMDYENGDIYEGEWLGDKHNGQGLFQLANGNRYEGTWKDGKKHGPGKFFYLDKGQLYEGVWVEDIAKCGTVVDFGREGAPSPAIYPVPKVHLADPVAVLKAQPQLPVEQE
ncbi:MORN repeat-containing protein 3 [Amia ocellicauda]|uniref:MORN repeat-containing protein 3 n=1 Tax=Amia ocellicauda TaxID=2972642 RepID=UPI0034640FB5